MNIGRAFRNFCAWFRPAEFWFRSVGPVDGVDDFWEFSGNLRDD